MHKCILARTQKMRQSDEASARHEKVSNHRCQLPTKQDIQLGPSKVGRQLKRVGEIAPPFDSEPYQEEDKMEVSVTCT